jgi:hypothetical protein
MSQRWSGQRVLEARRVALRRILRAHGAGTPILCPFCDEPILPGEDFDIDHATPRADGGAIFDPSNLRPSHASCNRAAGADMTNSRVRNRRTRKW